MVEILLFEKWSLLINILTYFSKSGLYFSIFDFFFEKWTLRETASAREVACGGSDCPLPRLFPVIRRPKDTQTPSLRTCTETVNNDRRGRSTSSKTTSRQASHTDTHRHYAYRKRQAELTVVRSNKRIDSTDESRRSINDTRNRRRERQSQTRQKESEGESKTDSLSRRIGADRQI